VNLKHGVPSDSFNHTCTSGAGTLILEFGMLSLLLNDSIYENSARKAIQSIYSKRNNLTGLYGNELNIHTGQWLGIMSGLGNNKNTFFSPISEKKINKI
jgi:mannosidase alpha-like ER degradation enhancer 1